MKKQFRGSFYLTLAALIWGMAFSAQSTAANYLGPFTFTAARSLITFAAISLFTLIKRRPARSEIKNVDYIKVGAPLGAILFLATVLQQMGLGLTTVAKSGFITALYIVIVPILGLFFGKKVSLPVWGGVALSLVGLSLLCLKNNLSIELGDLLTLGCAFVFSVHIIAVDRYATKLDAARLCAVQFGVAGVLSLVVALVAETIRFADIAACWVSVLYVGVLSGAFGYTLQIVGQRYTDPTIASLLLCLESVFAVVGAWILLDEGLLQKEIFGCALMLTGCVLAQLPIGRKIQKEFST